MPAAEPGLSDAPLSDAEIASLLRPVSRARRVALAVSGGADSLALMVAVGRWAARRKSPPHVLVLTVDHRLRPGSGREARRVAAMAEAMGMRARVLSRRGPPPKSDIEAAARAARYRLLVDASRAAGASHLIVAHHADDVAETFLLRARRGSNVFGLAAMRPMIPLGDPAQSGKPLQVFRPFLTVPRARLAATAVAARLTPIVDPMNDDPRFTRTRVRKLIKSANLDAQAIARIAFRFTALAEDIDTAASRFIARWVTPDAFGVARADRLAFRSVSDDVQLRVLVRILMAIGGEDHPPRFERLAALRAAVTANSAFKRTLAGVVAEGAGDAVTFYREAGRTGLPRLALRPGTSVIWDHRFLIQAAADAPAGLTVAAGPGRIDRTEGDGPRPPRGAIATLPALFRRGKMIALLGFPGGSSVTAVWGRPLLAEALKHPPLFPG